MQVTPYLFFDGRCEEAIEFYKHTLGAEVSMLMRNRESPEAPPPGTLPPGSENKIMHADEATAKRIFASLGDGGELRMPLAKTFFSPCFGMVTDRFGVLWMVYVMAT